MSTSPLIHLYDQTIRVAKRLNLWADEQKLENSWDFVYEDVCVPQETEEVVSFYFVFQV